MSDEKLILWSWSTNRASEGYKAWDFTHNGLFRSAEAAKKAVLEGLREWWDEEAEGNKPAPDKLEWLQHSDGNFACEVGHGDGSTEIFYVYSSPVET